MKVTALHGDRQHDAPSEAWMRLLALELAAPRYHAYPGPDHFIEAFDATSYRRWLKRRHLAGASGLSLYVHLPFCQSGCRHCACDKVVTRSRTRTRDYLAQLEREVAMVAAELGAGQKVSRMYWGGGTPNYFGVEELARLAEAIARHFRLRPGGDHAIEIDPRDAQPGLAARLAALGFTRLAVGVADLDPEVLRALRRPQAPGPTAEFIAEARRAGFRSIGVELVAGLPCQTAARFVRTLEQVIAMGPSRITLHAYRHRPDRHPDQRHIRAQDLPGIAELTLLHARAHECLAAADYEFIGIGHFARPDDPLARALRAGHLDWDGRGYTAQPESDLIGLGSSAISRVGAAYSQNLRSPDAYVEAVGQGRLPVAKGIELDPDDLVRRAVIHGICAAGRVSRESIEIAHLIDFRTYFAAEIRALGPWVEAGMVEVDDEWIAVTPPGRRYLRAISACFDRYLRESARRASVDPIL
jgi:oxygen-independent coproporphyrinogen-3 oxidase